MCLCIYSPAHLSVSFPVPLVQVLRQWLKWSYLLNLRDHSGICKEHTWLFSTKWELLLCHSPQPGQGGLPFPPSPGALSSNSQRLRLYFCYVIWAPLPALRPRGLADCLWTSLPGLSCIAQLSLIRTSDDPLPVVFKTEWLNWRTSVFISNTKITVTLSRHDFKLLIRHTFHATQLTA